MEITVPEEARHILIMPAIESGDATKACGGISPAYQFASDFPGTEDNPAPQLVVQLEDLIHRYLLEPADPAWPSEWAQMYDRHGDKRYAVNIVHVASNRIGPNDDRAFANGFDRVAAKVYQDTQVKVGFTLDVLPLPLTVNNGGCGQDDKVQDTYTASPEQTGPSLRGQASFLAVQAFIPEVFIGASDENTMLTFKRAYLEGWINQRVPVMLDADPGYDGHIVFPGSKVWGNNDHWREGISNLRDLPVAGVVYNTWNGYTEGYAAVPTREDGDVNFRWMQSLFK
jgi:hypothetical protein